MAVQIEQLDVVPALSGEPAPTSVAVPRERVQTSELQREREIALTAARLRARERRLQAD
jgi:hypothetical protein